MSEREPLVEDIDQFVELVSQNGIAERLGVSRQRVDQLRHVGALPPPFALIDGRIPVWEQEAAEQFIAERNKVLGKISLQE